MEQKVEFKRKLFTESIILAAIPIIAYYSAFQYKVGYFQAFGAPADLISVDIGTFVLFGSAIFGMCSILYCTA